MASLVFSQFTAQLDIQVGDLALALLTLEKVEKKKKKPNPNNKTFNAQRFGMGRETTET